MPLNKQIGYGSVFAYSTDGTSFTDVGSIIDGFNGPSTSADEVETTILSDTYKSYQRSQIDPGEASFEFAYDTADTNTNALVDLYNNGTVATWRVTFPDSSAEEFDGFLKDFGREVVKDSLIKANVTIRVSGDAGFTGA